MMEIPLSVSEYCAKFYVQRCHECDDANCTDNTNPSIVALKVEIVRLRAWLHRCRDHARMNGFDIQSDARGTMCSMLEDETILGWKDGVIIRKEE